MEGVFGGRQEGRPQKGFPVHNALTGSDLLRETTPSEQVNSFVNGVWGMTLYPFVKECDALVDNVRVCVT